MVTIYFYNILKLFPRVQTDNSESLWTLSHTIRFLKLIEYYTARRRDVIIA